MTPLHRRVRTAAGGLPASPPPPPAAASARRILVPVSGTHLSLPGHPLARALEEAGLRDVEIGERSIAFSDPAGRGVALPMSPALSEWARSAPRRRGPRVTVALSPGRAALVDRGDPGAAFEDAIAGGTLDRSPASPRWAGRYLYLYSEEGSHLFRDAETGDEVICLAPAQAGSVPGTPQKLQE